jgi:hypothetical protein
MWTRITRTPSYIIQSHGGKKQESGKASEGRRCCWFVNMMQRHALGEDGVVVV